MLSLSLKAKTWLCQQVRVVQDPTLNVSRTQTSTTAQCVWNICMNNCIKIRVVWLLVHICSFWGHLNASELLKEDKEKKLPVLTGNTSKHTKKKHFFFLMSSPAVHVRMFVWECNRNIYTCLYPLLTLEKKRERGGIVRKFIQKIIHCKYIIYIFTYLNIFTNKPSTIYHVLILLFFTNKDNCLGFCTELSR